MGCSRAYWVRLCMYMSLEPVSAFLLGTHIGWMQLCVCVQLDTTACASRQVL